MPRISMVLLCLVAGCGNGATAYTAQSQLVIADLVNGAFGHLLLTQTRLPEVGGDSQYIDPDYTPTSGCVVNRYDSGGTPVPNKDLDAGQATFSGFATNLLATDGKAPAPPGVYAAPIPSQIKCIKGMLNPYYDCQYGDAGGPEKIAGLNPYAVTLPAIPKAIYTAMCPACACVTRMIPDGAGGMMAVCEQAALAAGAVVTEDLGGGGGYSALTNVPLPALTDDLHLVRYTLGAADVMGLDAVTLDGTADLSVQWNCDSSPSNRVAASTLCPASSSRTTNLVALYAISSANPRQSWSPGARYSVALCFNPIDDPRVTLTLHKEAIQTLLGAQSGGSVLLGVMRLNVVPTTSLQHSVYLGAGRGQYTILNHAGNAGPDMAVTVDSGLTD